MASWLPLLRVAMPYLAQVVSAAAPAFTSRKSGDASVALITKQITELQGAVVANAESIRIVAEQMQRAAQAIEAAAAAQELAMSRLRRLVASALGAALLAVVLALVAMFR